MEQRSYLDNMQSVFENNYTIKKRKLIEEYERIEKDKKRKVLQVLKIII
jgi:hypothetical protein